MLQHLPEVPTMGRIGIKGIVGPALQTDVALLQIKPAPTTAGCVNIAPSLSEVFAVCDDLNEDVILTAETVERLSALNDYEAMVLVNQVTAPSNNSGNHAVSSDVSNTDDNVVSNVSDSSGNGTDVVSVGINSTSNVTDVVDNVCDTTTSVQTDGDVTRRTRHDETDLSSADTLTLITEQHDDPALTKYFDMVKNGNKQFFIRDGILYRRSKVQGNKVELLCLPERRIQTVLELAHDLPVSGHQAVRRTNDRIALSFFFPRQLQRVKEYCDSCKVCQLRARERRTDLVPIKPIERHEDNFGHLQADLIGPMGTGKYKYALVLTDVQSRFVTAFELTAPTASNVFDKLMVHCSIFGLPRYISFDCGTHFTSELTKICLARLRVSPRFHCPYNPRAAGLVERSIMRH